MRARGEPLPYDGAWKVIVKSEKARMNLDGGTMRHRSPTMGCVDGVGMLWMGLEWFLQSLSQAAGGLTAPFTQGRLCAEEIGKGFCCVMGGKAV